MRLDSSFCCVFLNLRLAFLKAYPLHISLTSTQSDISDLPQGIGTSLYYASRRTVPLYRKFLYLGVAFLDGLRRFLLRHGWSLLSAHGYRKGAVDFSAAPCYIFCLYGSKVISTNCSAHIVRIVAGSPIYVTSTRSPSEYPSADCPSGRSIPYPRLYSGALSSSKRIPI